MKKRPAYIALLFSAASAALLLSGCMSRLDDLTDRAINAVGTRASDAMEDVDVKKFMSEVKDKVNEALDSMPETSSALEDTVSSITSSFLNDVSSSSNSEESASPAEDSSTADQSENISAGTGISESESYSEKDDVALYIHSYGHLPSNYITTEEAKALGWDGESDLWTVKEGASIGGDEYANLSGFLPDGHNWKQCDVGYSGGIRGSERLIYSDDGLIYYSGDRFTTFTEITFSE